jgi:hypothetical protein
MMHGRTHSLIAVILTLTAAPAVAQWLNYPTPGIPRTPDGKPNLSAPAPRAPNGKPDLSGVSHAEPTPLAELRRLYPDLVKNAEATGVPSNLSVSKYSANILVDFRPDETPLRSDVRLRRDVGGTCLPLGIPFSFLLPEPNKIVQALGLIVIMYESDGTRHQIYTDGRPLPRDPQPSWLGYSTDKWQSDTLVVQTAGFNDKTCLDGMRHPHSETLRVTERYHRRDFGHLDLESMFDDPKMYTKPFTIKITQLLLADSDILEYVCNENEKDRAHLNAGASAGK